MSIEHFFVRSVTILTPPDAATGYGDGVEPDYGNPVETTSLGWLHQLAESEQHSATRSAEVSTHVLRLPAGVAINSKCQVQIDGQTFNVDGPPHRAWRPGGEHHTKVSLVYVDG